MSVKNFKFVSPGVFINEIDNSFVPKSPDAIGPVVIGRATRGLAMQPVKVESYSDFVEMFGDTVPGAAGGDVYRNGNYQSPMYGTYAAKAFLNANVAPLTYMRLLGQDDDNATTAGTAGWQTVKSPSHTFPENGGAFGLWLFLSSSVSGVDLGNGRLGAVWYINQSASIVLSGSVYSTGSSPSTLVTGGIGTVIQNDGNNLFRVVISSSQQGSEDFKFDFDDQGNNFIRTVFNTNPQLTSTPGAFYPSASAEDYWLGESYEQEVRRRSLVGASAYGVILPIAQTAAPTTGPHRMRVGSREAVAGWFIGQDLGATGSFNPEKKQKLFRLKGRGHGEWLHKNCKVSITNIRKSTSNNSDYGTFSLVVRALSDTDNNVQVMERFDNLTLDPGSPNFVARRIGDHYQQWDATNKMLKTYGEFPNTSKFVYVVMNTDVEAGATNPLLLPFGYYGPPRFKDTGTITGSYLDPTINATFINFQSASASPGAPLNADLNAILSGSEATRGEGAFSGSLKFPSTLLRLSASDAGLSDPTKVHFGLLTTRTATSTVNDPSVSDFFKLLYSAFPDDPTTSAAQAPSSLSGAYAWSYIFSMDDLVKASTESTYHWLSGSRAAGNGQAYGSTLGDGYRGFTAPFWGGHDGFNIKVPDPLYNRGMTEGTSTEVNNSSYYTWKRAMDTVSDPEFLDMNMLVAPGLTLDSLATHQVRVCEERADALAVIDLPNVYLPSHEIHYSDKSSRIGTTPTNAATALRNRQIDSSYGCTFYPWVQTRDEATGRLLWVPPSVAMMGVLASSEKKSELWFAPAGFNRGGLSEGAAGIPVSSITERLVSKDRDTLYEANINPIASFPSTGIVVFGQKTLQEQQSALDRINVRRLVIFLKKRISILSSQVLFDQNVQTTWNRFKALIDPLLANVKGRFGITDYRLILDETTTTPDLIDQNILYAKIMIKPARAIEFIAIDFVIMSTGASFDD